MRLHECLIRFKRARLGCKEVRDTPFWAYLEGPFDNIPEADEYVTQLQKLFNELVYVYQIIVVTSAGTNYKEPYANNNLWPSLLAAEIDINCHVHDFDQA